MLVETCWSGFESLQLYRAETCDILVTRLMGVDLFNDVNSVTH